MGTAERYCSIAARHLRFIKFLSTACGAVFLETTHAAFSSVGFWPGRVPKERMKSVPRSRRNFARSARTKSACVSVFLRGIRFCKIASRTVLCYATATLTGQDASDPFYAGVSKARGRLSWQIVCEIRVFLPFSAFSAGMCVSYTSTVPVHEE